MDSPAFRKAVQAAFECSAVRLVEGGDKVLQKCGPKGLHALLASCHSQMQDENADAVTLAMDTLNAFFGPTGGLMISRPHGAISIHCFHR